MFYIKCRQAKLGNQGLKAENATTELCPPNPNEFEMAEIKKNHQLAVQIMACIMWGALWLLNYLESYQR